MEHDPEKWEPVSEKDHAQQKVSLQHPLTIAETDSASLDHVVRATHRSAPH
jgi:hypothetical protein